MSSVFLDAGAYFFGMCCDSCLCCRYWKQLLYNWLVGWHQAHSLLTCCRINKRLFLFILFFSLLNYSTCSEYTSCFPSWKINPRILFFKKKNYIYILSEYIFYNKSYFLFVVQIKDVYKVVYRNQRCQDLNISNLANIDHDFNTLFKVII